MSQCPLCPAIPSPGLAQAGLRECLLRERTHCDVTFSLCLVSDKIVESAMPFTSWASHLPPPHPGPGKTEDEGLSRQGPSPSSSSWHRSKQWVNKWGSTSGPSLAKLAAGLLCSAPLPPLSRCGKVNRPQGIARLSLSGILRLYPESNHLSLLLCSQSGTTSILSLLNLTDASSPVSCSRPAPHTARGSL